MIFDSIIGQQNAINVLKRAFENNRLAHAYLFHGPAGVGKEALAIELARAAVCEAQKDRPCAVCASCVKMNSFSHPDVFFIFAAPSTVKPEDERAVLDSVLANPYWRMRPWASPTISIDKIREIRKTSSLKSFEGAGRVVIISEAEKMTTPAANALLKLLEEPPPQMTMILTSSKPNALLPTIVSRCQQIRCELLKEANIEEALRARENIESAAARLLSRVANGSYRHALELQDEDLNQRREIIVDILRTVIQGDYERLLKVEELQQGDRTLIKDYLKLLLLWFRDIMLLSQFPDEDRIEEKITNYDQLETLRKFLGAFESIHYEAAITALEESLIRIDRNIHMGLLLTVLFQRLHAALRRK
jgi:DNA polymerase-3 subunit delta'